MQFKSTPFAHQLAEFELSRDAEHRALFWEMGVGKTKPTIDTAAHLFEAGEVDGMLVIAPSGVERNWITDELPAHLPIEDPRTFLWRTKKAGTKRHANAFAEFMGGGAGPFRVMAASYDALMTVAGAKAIRAFLEGGRRFYVLDESTAIKSPSAKRTIRCLASAKYAPYRRILTGTPVDNSPFDVFTQLKFLDPEVWEPIGCSRSEAFKAHFGVWNKRSFGRGGKEFPQLVAYRRLDELHRIVDAMSSRLLKDDVLDLPPKLYDKVTFELSAEQRRAYDELREEFLTWLDDGAQVTAPLAITRILRLQQVTSGYLPDDDERRLRPIGSTNPRLVAMRALMESIPHQAIVWAKYDADIDGIMDLAKALGRSAVQYDGRTSDEDRAAAKAAFKAGDAQLFVSKPAVGGEGLTLTEAKTVVYYNNDFRLKNRLQSEDRAHRIGQDRPVKYYDLVAARTIDEHILRSLRKKRDLSDEVLGDDVRSWI